jgi:SAM-dependent methyltransferase
VTPTARQAHWEDVYTRKREDEVSWFQPEAAVSLELIDRCGVPADARIIDVGGGASRLVDGLLDRGFGHVTVLDLSSAALAKARERLGERASRVQWVAADVTTFVPPTSYAVWHDRAVFHFLTAEADREAYVRVLERAVLPGGHVIVGTFALDGPLRCSGLEVARYDPAGLAAVLGASLTLVESRRHEHVTPGGKVQAFTFVRFVRR